MASPLRIQRRPDRVRRRRRTAAGAGWPSCWASRPAAVTLSNDIELAYLASFAPGAGYLVYAGTGSIGAYIDADHVFHRAGGRGVLLDDGGGGFWIAREALRHIWRNEDEQPGCWRDSPLAQAVFEHIGGADWNLSRQFIYRANAARSASWRWPWPPARSAIRPLPRS